MIRRQLRIIVGLLVTLIAWNASAQSQLGLKEPYEETHYRQRLEDEKRAERIDQMQESVGENLSIQEQRKHLERFTDKVLTAQSIRDRLRAHADLLAMLERVHDAVDETIANPNADASQRVVALWALGERGSERACRNVRAARPIPNDSLYMLAYATARGRCGDVDALTRVLQDGNEYTRPRAAVTLGMLGVRQARSAIAQAARNNEDENYANYYVLAQGLLGDASVTEELKTLLNDRELHLHAAIALARLQEEYIVFDLLAATRSPESLVRWAAVKELLPITDRLVAICDRLEQVASDDDAQIAALYSKVEESCYY